jgi:branched-chain amino acid transport system ATP-binding protein
MSVQAPAQTGGLNVEGLAAGYFGAPVVRDITLHVTPGEVVTMLGPNGAGKTTTLETIAGLHAPMAGTVSLHGHSVAGTAAHLRARDGLALVPEGRALFFSLTVAEHLKLARSKDGVGRSELLTMLPELEKCWDRKAGLLSGGEQQMLAIGRALVSRPRILLVDEMSLGLAPVIVERLLPILRRAASEMGCAVLFVEQHVALALEIADRAYVLNHGRIVLEGPAEQLRRNRDLITASYLGETAVDSAAPATTSTTKGDPPA